MNTGKEGLRIGGLLLGAALAASMPALVHAKIELPDSGAYVIAPAMDLNKAIRPAEYGGAGEAPFEIGDISGFADVVFKAELHGDGFFEIINTVTGKAMQADTCEAGILLQENVPDASDGQRWILVPNGDDTYLVQSVFGTVLECIDGDTENGTAIRLNIEDGSEAQKWVLLRNGVNSEEGIRDGSYAIAASLDLEKVLCVSGGSEEDAPVVIWDHDAEAEELFTIEYQAEGFYKIASAQSGKVLAVQDASAESGAQLVMKSYDGSAPQQWLITENEAGRFLIQSSLGTYLECTMSDTTNGNPIQLWQLNELPNQEWILLPEGLKAGNIPELIAGNEEEAAQAAL